MRFTIEIIFKPNAVALFATMLVVIAMGCSGKAVSPEPDLTNEAFPATFLLEGLRIAYSLEGEKIEE